MIHLRNGENNMDDLVFVYTADEEEPDCCRCDNCCRDCDCCEQCGPEYGWANYKRTEKI